MTCDRNAHAVSADESLATAKWKGFRFQEGGEPVAGRGEQV